MIAATIGILAAAPLCAGIWHQFSKAETRERNPRERSRKVDKVIGGCGLLIVVCIATGVIA